MAVLVGVFLPEVTNWIRAQCDSSPFSRPFCCVIFASESFISNATQRSLATLQSLLMLIIIMCVCVCLSQHFYGLLQIGTKQAHLMACPPGGVAQNIMCELHTLSLHVCVCVCLCASVFASLCMHIIHFIRSVDATTLSYPLLGFDVGYTWLMERECFVAMKTIK